jgi:hypothetical protein
MAASTVEVTPYALSGKDESESVKTVSFPQARQFLSLP